MKSVAQLCTHSSKTSRCFADGSISRMADGRFDVRFRLWDAVKGQDLGGQSYVVVPNDLRLVSHRIADQVYEKLTGDKGIFSTRIAIHYQTRPQTPACGLHDADGENPQSSTDQSGAHPFLPVGHPVAMSWLMSHLNPRKPVVYIHDIASGKRRVLANFKGSNSAPLAYDRWQILGHYLEPRRWLPVVFD
jgi:TolB protein